MVADRKISAASTYTMAAKHSEKSIEWAQAAQAWFARNPSKRDSDVELAKFLVESGRLSPTHSKGNQYNYASRTRALAETLPVWVSPVDVDLARAELVGLCEAIIEIAMDENDPQRPPRLAEALSAGIIRAKARGFDVNAFRSSELRDEAASDEKAEAFLRALPPEMRGPVVEAITKLEEGAGAEGSDAVTVQ